MAVRERHLVYTTIQPGATEPKNEHLTNVQIDEIHANKYGQTSIRVTTPYFAWSVSFVFEGTTNGDHSGKRALH